MKIKKCPYCGKRITYRYAWMSRRKGEFFCQRCGKESRVVISNKIYLVFAAFVALSLAILAATAITNNTNNIWCVVLVAIPLLIFMALTPKFVSFVPLKKYKNSMEARRAGIEYSDNILSDELDSKDSSSEFGGDGFKINAEVFNKIKSERSAAKIQLESDDISSDSKKIIQDSDDIDSQKTMAFVPVIKNVSENHSSTEAPLKKLNSDSGRSVRRTHYYADEPAEKPEKNEHKPQTNRYSANRKF